MEILQSLKTSKLLFFLGLILLTLACDTDKRTYYESGEIMEEWEESDGEKDGYYKEYYKSGKLRQEQYWRDGVLDGDFKTYYQNGKLAQHFTYQNGNRVGKASLYNESGNLIETQFYDSVGRLVDYKKFNTDGTQKQEIGVLIHSLKDTIKENEIYRAEIRLGNLPNERYDNGTLVIATQWDGYKPLDTVFSSKTSQNRYNVELTNHKRGYNLFKGNISILIPLDTIEGSLLTTKYFEYDYFVE